jgi:hypothetical protein
VFFVQEINCNVNNCSHNKKGICYSNRVDIGGISASSECGTCCGSFLNKALYSALTNNTNSTMQCTSLICKAENCAHNYNNLCDLRSIDVSGLKAQIYAETECASFNAKLY